jgi:hypothetical protein
VQRQERTARWWLHYRLVPRPRRLGEVRVSPQFEQMYRASMTTCWDLSGWNDPLVRVPRTRRQAPNGLNGLGSPSVDLARSSLTVNDIHTRSPLNRLGSPKQCPRTLKWWNTGVACSWSCFEHIRTPIRIAQQTVNTEKRNRLPRRRVRRAATRGRKRDKFDIDWVVEDVIYESCASSMGLVAGLP